MIERLLPRLLRAQAYRELAGARLFESSAHLAPREAERKLLAHHAREERAHYEAVLGVWAAWSGEPRAVIEARVEDHLRANPLPTAEEWLDIGMARFLYDRAGYWQLQELAGCSFPPLGELACAIVDDEEDHLVTGQRDLRAAISSAGRDRAQALLEKWLRPALRSFGRSGTAGSAQAIAAGLKRRDPAAVMQDFLDDIRLAIAGAGLALPAPATLGLDLPAGLRW